MISKNHLLFLAFSSEYKFAFLGLLTAFVVSMLVIPQIIRLVTRYRLYDIPDARKEHKSPVPTLGGVGIFLGLAISMCLWVPLRGDASTIAFCFSIVSLFLLGIFDDLKNLAARYKFLIEIALALLIAISGYRIESFNGILGIHELPVTAQYLFTILAIVGITNAFNLIDGIDGLAGSVGFMSLVTLGILLMVTGKTTPAIIAFSLAGSVAGFLYFNFNPARIFMGDTGSLLIGFVVAVLSIQLMQGNQGDAAAIPHIPVVALGISFIPVFDTLRVFTLRIWKGSSPFNPDKTHIHHLLTNCGLSHGLSTKIICSLHATVLMLAYLLEPLYQEITILLIVSLLLMASSLFRRLPSFPHLYSFFKERNRKYLGR